MAASWPRSGYDRPDRLTSAAEGLTIAEKFTYDRHELLTMVTSYLRVYDELVSDRNQLVPNSWSPSLIPIKPGGLQDENQFRSCNHTVHMDHLQIAAALQAQAEFLQDEARDNLRAVQLLLRQRPRALYL